MRLAIFVLLPFLLGAEQPDPLLQSMRRSVSEWRRTLPDFICRQSTQRFKSGPGPDWYRCDRDVFELAVLHGREHYLLQDMNGQILEHPAPIDYPALSSRGEFASSLLVLFAQNAKTEFHRRGSRRIGDQRRRRYDFSVSKKDSQWYVGVEPEFTPAYTGSLWVDESSGEVWQLHMETNRFPGNFRIREAWLSVDYKPVQIAGESYLMPSRADLRVCERGSGCERKLFEFTDYRQFSATSRIVWQP